MSLEGQCQNGKANFPIQEKLFHKLEPQMILKQCVSIICYTPGTTGNQGDEIKMLSKTAKKNHQASFQKR